MTEKEKKKESGGVSRREFLKDAGLLVGGTAIGSTVLLAACGDGDGATETVTNTVTTTEQGGTSTKTITTTEHVGEVTKTVTETVSTFVCPVCGQEFDSLSELQAHFVAMHPTEPVPEKLTKLTVNGRVYELFVQPNWTLAYVLREKLGLTGTKVSCDRGACGFCTVLIDGRPMLSCMTLAATCDGKNIETIEGLADPVTLELHPIQRAFVEHDGIQCGFCTAGMIMCVKALLDKNLEPIEEDVKKALSGVLCRCSNYPNIIESTLAAAKVIKGG